MNSALESLKSQLERIGADDDVPGRERSRRMLNITRDTGEFLRVLVLATAARRVLEIGTSNGYSTLWLGEAAEQLGGRVTTVESADDKVALAAANFERSGLAAIITLVHEDATAFLERAAAGAWDLIFLDADRACYAAWWPRLHDALRRGGALVIDNATSHSQEIAPLRQLIMADGGFASCVVPVGKGELVAVKTST